MSDDHVRRFWSFVIPEPNTGCWLWMGTTVRGYGGFTAHGRKHLAHRYAFALTNGPCPASLDLCHRCDNPPCVNPGHLFLGTAAENVADMFRKGRKTVLRGEAHGSSKLAAWQVEEIRMCAEVGTTQQELAERFGVSQSHVGQIIHRKAWKVA